MASPLLYDLTELQRHANRVFGFSAQQTLNLAQALYERHKLISYPRTDSRHLSQDVALTLAQIVKAIAAPYQPHCAPGTGERPLGRRFVDDAKVTDHHAIIPTTSLVENASLSSEERKIYDLICRRLLSAWHDDHIASTTTVITAISNGDVVDRYHTSGTAVQQVGWKVLDLVTARKPGRGKADTEEQKQVLPSGLKQGDPQEVLDVKAERGGAHPALGRDPEPITTEGSQASSAPTHRRSGVSDSTGPQGPLAVQPAVEPPPPGDPAVTKVTVRRRGVSDTDNTPHVTIVRVQ